MYTIEVVTRVPDIQNGDYGNAASAIVYGLDPTVMMHVLTQGRVEVFSLGEILIMQGERDIAQGRKPSKWDVDTEEFDTLDEAVKRALEVKGEA